MNTEDKSQGQGKRIFSLLLGPLLFASILLLPAPIGMESPAQAVLACTAWIAAWWVLEPIPIPATSLLPIVLLPLSGGLPLGLTTAAYGNPLIFLFLGGFVLALALEEWNLHKRIALHIILLVGTNEQKIVLGFMAATGVLSMWISNTATSMLMMPIGLAIVLQLGTFTGSGKLGKENNFGKALMLGIAYAASIGGLGTLIGTPANAIFAAVVKEMFGQEISFARWMLLGIPLSVALILLCWFYLVRIAFSLTKKDTGGKKEIKRQLKELGPLRAEEKRMTAIFALTAFGWISRGFLLNPIFPALDDSMLAMAAAVAVFVIPAPSKGNRQGLLSWDAATKLPWGILLLFGGGLAIAAGFQQSGLAAYIGTQLSLLEGLSLFAVILAIVFLMNFLTELTSNTATATMMLPILASLAVAIEVHPFGLMSAAALASSCAFMLPVATPPNAIVFSSGYIRMQDMVKTGFWLNIISILIICLFVYFLLPLLWGIKLQELPLYFH